MKMSEPTRWAMVKDGVIENVCLWDGNTRTWAPPKGYEMIPAGDNANSGDLWNGKEFTKPAPVDPPVEDPAPQDVTVQQVLDLLVRKKLLRQDDAQSLGQSVVSAEVVTPE